MNRYVKKGGILLFWLGVWTLLALAVDNRILAVTPLETAARLLQLLGEKDFWISVSRSFLRIATGFFAGLGAALLLAALSRRLPFFEELLSPVMKLIMAVPVASFAVLLLIWWGSSFLAVAVCFLVVLPGIYTNALEGLKAMDKKLLEMAGGFRLPFRSRFFYIYCPALKPFLCGSMKVALGMCWKSGVAAEVIGIPDFSLGERIYMSKIYLDTAGVFAWSAVVILMSVLFEKLVLKLADLFFAWQPACRRPEQRRESCSDIVVENLEKSFGEQKVISGLEAVYRAGEIYYLRSPSGSGKTTLLHILAGILKPDGGRISKPDTVSVMFQEDRLCEDYSAVKNVELVCGDRSRAAEALAKLLEPEALEKPCGQLSGGMKRRVALVRAMEADSAFVLLDEPFTGMDEQTRSRAMEYIRRRQNGRTLIIATHIS
ncbi:MAG: ATP-binding cassette domain-containing protein [Acetatifactor sp.]|nr:ATP-binding cassette domain-containing protein [Acetatifactor sp.]